MKMKLLILSIQLLFVLNTVAQQYDRVVYKADTFFTFRPEIFFDDSFKKPTNVPDGSWIILDKNSNLIYKFSTLDNCINGDYEEHFLFSKSYGRFRMDSLWTFRFNQNDHEFREGQWDYISDYSRLLIENLWYPNGVRKYQDQGNVRKWFFHDGSIMCIQTDYQSGNDWITIQMIFEQNGQIEKLVRTNTEVACCDTSIADLTWFPTEYYYHKKYFTETSEYKNGVLQKKINENNNFISTIFYDKVGIESSMKRIKKKHLSKGI